MTRLEPGATAGPLNGYRILEFGSNLAAPVATMLMGDQGADVIKVEPPSGDPLRQSGNRRDGVDGMGTMFLNANRNKRSVMLDLKRPADRSLALRLAAACDVVVQNFRPGVMERLGLGYEAVRGERADTIYVSIDGVGTEGPAAGRRVYDIVVQGLSGLAGVQADPETGEPATIRNAVVDKATALCVWQAVTAALLVRARTGKGQHVRISMLNVALSFVWPESMSRGTLVGGSQVAGGSMSGVRYCYATSDGHILVGFVTDQEFKAVCTVLGCDHLTTDKRFDTSGKRFANASALNAEVASRLSTRSTTDWLTRLATVDAVYAPINWPDTVADDPQVKAIGAIDEYDHPTVGRYRQPVHPVRFSENSTGLWRHAPQLGEGGDDVLAELGVLPGPQP